MPTEIVTDFALSVRQSNQAEDIFGDTTDDVIGSLLKHDVFDKVPILGYFVKGHQIVEDIRTQRFCKKIYLFLYHTKDYDRQKLDEFFKEYSNANQENGYDLMLSVLERIDNINKVTVMANLLHAKLDDQISIDDFVRLTASLDRVPYVDLMKLPEYESNRSISKDTYMLSSSGLVYEFVIDAGGDSKYRLNENGVLFVRYGLKQRVADYQQESNRIPGFITAKPIPDGDIMTIINQ